MAGAGAGWATALVTCPLDVVKIRLQSGLSPTNIGQPRVNKRDGGFLTARALSNIWRTEGVRGLYRGLGPTMVGYLPSFAIYFPVYHRTKRLLHSWHPHWPPALVHVASAMTAGGLSNIATNPLWVVRTRLMTQHIIIHNHSLYRNSWDAICSIWKREGVYGFYKGASTSLLGVFHVAIQFPLYEQFKIWSGDRATHPLNIILASTISKVVASSATYPHEIIRTRLQIQRDQSPRYSHLVNVIRDIYRRQGVIGFYAGLPTNILRVIPASAVTFLSYETILKLLGHRNPL